MRNERTSSKSGLFLIELIISIVFFAVASAICTQLFVQAHLISRRSGDISIAASIAQNCAEELKALDGAAWKERISSGETDIFFYDIHGLPPGDAGGVGYHAALIYDGSSAPLYRARIEVYKTTEEMALALHAGENPEGTPLFHLQVSDYTRNKT